MKVLQCIQIGWQIKQGTYFDTFTFRRISHKMLETWQDTVILSLIICVLRLIFICIDTFLKKSDEKVLQSFEMWVWRRVLRISWTERETNKWVRERIGVKEEDGIVKQLKRRKLVKYMHWKRWPESTVMTSIEGEIMGKNKRGKRRTAWVDNIREWSGGMSMARNNAWKHNIVLIWMVPTAPTGLWRWRRRRSIGVMIPIISYFDQSCSVSLFCWIVTQ